jgi:hypothetical protein
MKNRIYIVSYHILDFDTWDIYKYCSTEKIAIEKKQQLLNNIQNIKTLYYLEYDSDYDEDLRLYTFGGFGEEPFPENYDEISDRVIIYRAKHEELGFSDIAVEEKELL